LKLSRKFTVDCKHSTHSLRTSLVVLLIYFIYITRNINTHSCCLLCVNLCKKVE